MKFTGAKIKEEERKKETTKQKLNNKITIMPSNTFECSVFDIFMWKPAMFIQCFVTIFCRFRVGCLHLFLLVFASCCVCIGCSFRISFQFDFSNKVIEFNLIVHFEMVYRYYNIQLKKINDMNSWCAIILLWLFFSFHSFHLFLEHCCYSLTVCASVFLLYILCMLKIR